MAYRMSESIAGAHRLPGIHSFWAEASSINAIVCATSHAYDLAIPDADVHTAADRA